ncbi:MAG: hypothetical protein ACE5I9_00875 [Candidatus Methylomirabilales bacterium]
MEYKRACRSSDFERELQRLKDMASDFEDFFESFDIQEEFIKEGLSKKLPDGKKFKKDLKGAKTDAERADIIDKAKKGKYGKVSKDAKESLDKLNEIRDARNRTNEALDRLEVGIELLEDTSPGPGCRKYGLLRGEDGDQAFETPGGYHVSYGAGMTVSYDSAEAWEGGTTPVPPAGPPVVAQGPGPTGLAPPPGTPAGPGDGPPPGEQPGGGPPTIPVAQPEVFLALPTGWDACGPGCKPPATGGPPLSREVWCLPTSTCTNRGAECDCHLFKKKKKGPPTLEYVAKPRKKIKKDNKYTYHCYCVRPVPTSGQPGGEVPTTPVAQVPRDGDEPKDTAPPEAPHEQDTPQPPGPVLTVKATQTVLTGGASQTVAVPQAMIKLNVGPAPALPLAGNPRDEVTDASAEPLQGLTGPDGTLALALPQPLASALPAASPAAEVAVDLTPQQSTLVHLAVDPDKANATAPATYLHPGLVPYVTRSWLLNGTLIAVLHYPQARTAAVTELLALSANVTHQEENYCRGKQPGPPRSLLRPGVSLAAPRPPDGEPGRGCARAELWMLRVGTEHQNSKRREARFQLNLQ